MLAYSTHLPVIGESNKANSVYYSSNQLSHNRTHKFFEESYYLTQRYLNLLPLKIVLIKFNVKITPFFIFSDVKIS